MTSQATLNEQLQQQQLLMYFDAVLLDFDNESEMLKIIKKFKRVKQQPKVPKQK